VTDSSRQTSTGINIIAPGNRHMAEGWTSVLPALVSFF